MIVLDVNILLYAYDSNAPLFEKAHKWIGGIFSDDLLVGLPWSTISGFLRISTNSRLPGHRFAIEEAIAIVNSWLQLPNVLALAPGEDHWLAFQQMISQGQAKGDLMSDAQLAALTLEHGGVLHTTDRDFSRFPGLRWINPLV